MNNSASSTILVKGSSQVLRRPSSLMLIGRIHESASTLELALQNLNQRRGVVSRWLSELEAKDIEFGEPRFPEQVEPNQMRIAKKMIQQRLASPPLGNIGKRSVLVLSLADRRADRSGGVDNRFSKPAVR